MVPATHRRLSCPGKQPGIVIQPPHGGVQQALFATLEDIQVIERNLGNIERVIRLLFGLLFLAWAVSQPAISAMEWFVIAIAAALMLNGIFSRCYLWYVLDLNTCQRDDNGCRPDPGCY